jgi:5-bromo-4-chloroindolyl phosphate hydrolysis protein
LREYILTERERKIIRTFLERGEKLEGFRQLLFRARHMEKIKEDLKLIQKLLETVEQS